MISSTQTNQPFASPSDPDQPDYVEAAVAKLRAAKLRITGCRVKLLRALAAGGRPMSIDELHAAVGPETCDLVTVYRCMVAFEDHDIVHRSYRHSGTTLYEQKLGARTRYRIVCKVTHQAEELDAATSQRLAAALEEAQDALRARGYTSVSHLLEFFGVQPRHETVAPPPIVRQQSSLKVE